MSSAPVSARRRKAAPTDDELAWWPDLDELERVDDPLVGEYDVVERLLQRRGWRALVRN